MYGQRNIGGFHPNSGVTTATDVLQFGSHTGLQADLSDATAITINTLRNAFQMQRFLERDARGGTRYTELNRAHFGVISPDSRLQRPEYLGGGTLNISVNPVAQTSSTDSTTPQGNLAAYGVLGTNNVRGFTKSFTEHGYVFVMVCARADLTYQNNVNRMWSRRTRYDFYWPVFSHLGEQAVLNKEIYYANNPTIDNGVFGYQERYAEYRYYPSLITGKFRSGISGSLDVWHLAQHFTSTPVLGDGVITEHPPIDRVIAVPSEPHFLLDAYFNVRAIRPMPLYSVPGMLDHF